MSGGLAETRKAIHEESRISRTPGGRLSSSTGTAELTS